MSLVHGVVSKCHVLNAFFSSSFLLRVSAVDKKADCTITMADSDLLALMTGKMNPQSVSTMSQTYVNNTISVLEVPGEPEVVPALSVVRNRFL